MSGQTQQSKADIIAERQANLPLPEEPPVKSDWNSADPSTVNIGSGRQSEPISTGEGALREPATGDSAVRAEGATGAQGTAREGKDGLSGIPSDAVTRDTKNKAGVVDTTN